MPRSQYQQQMYIDADIQTEDLHDDEEFYVTRSKPIQRRYAGGNPIEQLKTITAEPLVSRKQQKLPSPSAPVEKKQLHWLVFVGAGMLVCLMLFCFATAVGSWWNNHQEDVTYGNPRTYQIDAVVGHGDSVSNPSHFIFLNLHSHIIVIEFPGGDASKAITYTGPTLIGDNSDLIPVTGSFVKDLKTGRDDLEVQYQGQSIVFVNNGSKFVPPQN